ncbi:hypothetical protein MF271_16170 [Deinococcus sp. KNUC1210]|uniref:GNAT family N-acetyltransferase n=1 Tax=Deinococcus sp. KNUC1210 TaxID=2917691 RepID=UPI001EF0B30D|nr:GNAT family N-acetyltransferase [Deinococcus sp. KNUC1210]ULH15436.1 hypothetical protein MF271_16170 [Deinococcus sp. KNUC1210]
MPDALSSSLPSPSALAAVTLAMQHPLTRRWLPDEQRLPLLADAHEEALELATSLEIAAMRAAHFGFDHVEPEEYLDRWTAVSGDLSALLSIRFEGLDRTRPFVNVSGLSRPWTMADLPALRQAALGLFGAFGPHYLRLFSAEPIDALPGLERDRRFLAAPLAELAATSADIPPELTLRPTLDDTHLHAAQAAYAATDLQHPAHARQASVLDAEQLAEAVEAGSMFDVLVGGVWAGYVGTLPHDKLGLPADSVQELLLTPAFRGRGYGPHLTTLLARALPATGRVLFGTIDADNRGARAAALRAGRLDVGGWVKMNLDRAEGQPR